MAVEVRGILLGSVWISAMRKSEINLIYHTKADSRYKRKNSSLDIKKDNLYI